ncbi:MAG: hypothetical protein ACI4II_09150 [Acutalibacteraceae bacterium]
MQNEDLRKLSRIQLLELLIEQTKENNELRQQLEEANKKLQSREIILDEAGSIANAALQLNGIFNIAEAAASQYLDNIRLLHDRQNEICARMEAEAREKAQKMLVETQEKCLAKERESEKRIKMMSDKIDKFYADSQELYNLLQQKYQK